MVEQVLGYKGLTASGAPVLRDRDLGGPPVWQPSCPRAIDHRELEKHSRADRLPLLIQFTGHGHDSCCPWMTAEFRLLQQASDFQDYLARKFR